MNKLVILAVCGMVLCALESAEGQQKTPGGNPAISVTLGADDGGRYYEEDYGVSPENAGRAYGGTSKDYGPGMKVYPNAPGGIYRLWFYGRDESEKKYNLIPFFFRKSDKISDWTIDFQLQPGRMSDDYVDFTAAEFQAIIDRFPVWIDQLYM
jgi:hypothetical protein